MDYNYIESAENKIDSNDCSSINNSPGVNDAITIIINVQKIQEIVYDLSRQSKTDEDWIWLLAEYELRLVLAYVGSNPSLSDTLSEKIISDPNKIVDYPLTEQTKQLAKSYKSQIFSQKTLCWELATRIYIYRGKIPHESHQAIISMSLTNWI